MDGLASKIITPGFTHAEDNQQRLGPWLPQAANGEVVTRFADVVANGANHAGHALTNFLRFLILLPAIVTLLIAEGCVRLDQQLVKKLGGAA